MSQRHTDTTPLPSSTEFLENMRKAKEDEEWRNKTFFHRPRDRSDGIIYIPHENFCARTIAYARKLEEVYRLVDVMQDMNNRVLKLEDKNGVIVYFDDRFDTLKHVRPQSLICFDKKDPLSLFVKDSGGYYTLPRNW